MKIKKLAAVYGKLSGETLEFGGGLDIVSLPNEGGKSTWCSFILSMLYGVDTSQKDKAARLADKNKYQPWNGGRMSGSMELETEGKTIRIERGSQGSAMAGFKATDAHSGKALDIDPKNAGTVLMGIERSVFERSAFIGQNSVRTQSSPELEKRLESFAGSADGSASYAPAKEQLRKWRRKLKYNSQGILPELEGKSSELKERIAGIEEASCALAEAKVNLKECESNIKEAQSALEAHRQIAEYDLTRELAKARMELMRIQNEIKRQGVRAVDRNELTALEKGEAEVRALKRQAGLLEIKRDDTLRKESDLRAEVPEVFSGLSAEQAVQRARKDEEKCEKLAQRTKGSRLAAPIVLLALALVFAAVFVFVLAKTVFVLTAAIFVAAAVTYFVLYFRDKKRALTQREHILELYAGKTPGELAEEYSQATREAEQAALRCAEAVQVASFARQEADKAEEALLKKASEVLGGSGTLDEIGPAVEFARQKAEENLELTRKYESAQELVNSLSAALGNDSGKYELKAVPHASMSISEAEDLLERSRIARERALSAAARYEEKIISGGDVDRLRAEYEKIHEAIDAAKRDVEAIDMALDCLNSAQNELQSDFSPKLNELAGEYFARLTGGKYSSVRVGDELSPSAGTENIPVERDERWLSEGTADQMYLAVRLALCDMLAPDAPMILDDVFANYDDERMGLALDELLDISRTRQVIIFTCHTREKEYLEGRKRDE